MCILQTLSCGGVKRAPSVSIDRKNMDYAMLTPRFTTVPALPVVRPEKFYKKKFCFVVSFHLRFKDG